MAAFRIHEVWTLWAPFYKTWDKHEPFTSRDVMKMTGCEHSMVKQKMMRYRAEGIIELANGRHRVFVGQGQGPSQWKFTTAFQGYMDSKGVSDAGRGSVTA